MLAGSLAELVPLFSTLARRFFVSETRYWPSVGPRVESRPVEGQETCPLPDDPVLAATAAALNEAGQWADIFDADGRFVYMTDEVRLIFGGGVELAPVPLGLFVWGPEATRVRMEWLAASSRWRSFAARLRSTRPGASLTPPADVSSSASW